MQSFLASLFLFLMSFSSFQANATVICDPKSGKCHFVNNTITPNKQFQEDFDRKAKQPIDQTFYGDQNSDGNAITVSRGQKIQITLTLPDDEDNGELTHQYDLIGSVDTESPLQYFACNDLMKGGSGPLNFEEFYLTGGLHPLELQQGVTMSFCVVANKVSDPQKPFTLTFRLWNCRFHRKPDVPFDQYRTTGTPKEITWSVIVKDEDPIASQDAFSPLASLTASIRFFNLKAHELSRAGASRFKN